MDSRQLKTKTVSGFFWKICERVAAQVVSFVVTIVLARLLMPEDYAPITLLTIFIAVANIFIADGFCAALVQKKNIDALDYSSVLIASLGLACGIYMILFFLAPYVAAFYALPILTPTLRVLALRVPLAAINSVEIAYLTRKMRFRAFFWGTIIGTVVSAFTGIGAALYGLGTWALVIQNLTNYVIDTIVLLAIIRKIPPLRFSISRVKPLLQYGYKVLLNNLSFTLIDQARALIIGKRYSASDLAYYSKGKQMPQLVSTCVLTPMASVLFPTMSAVNDDISKVKAVYRRGIQILTYAIYPLLLGLAAVSYNLIRLLLTDKWLFSAPFMIVFCFYYLFPPLSSINQEAVKAIGRSDQLLKYGVYNRCISIVTLLITVWFDPMIIAIGMIVSILIATGINAYQNKKLFSYSYKEQMADWLPNLFLGFTMFAITFLVGKLLTFHYVAVLAVQVCVAVVTYILLSFITKNQSFQFIMQQLNARKK